MGTAPSRNPFLPTPPNYSQQIMTKIWTVDSESQASNQLSLLSSIKDNQNGDGGDLYCKIVCCHKQRVTSEGCWKVIAAFEYPSRSLRQEIILRKKRDRKVMYFTQKELAQILHLVGLFIIDHYAYLCSHSDIFSNLFLLDNGFKLCRPELLPLRCPNKFCSNSHFRQKLADDILQLILLEKVVRGGHREKEKAQYLYSHSKWLGALLEDVVSDRDILRISSQSKYIKDRCYNQKEVDVLSEFVRREQEKSDPISDFDLKLSSQDDLKPEKNPQQQKNAEKTKPSLSTKIHRSFSFEKQQKKQPQLPQSPFYHQHKQKKMLLDQYPRQLAESIDDHEDSNSAFISPYQNINDVDPVTYPNDMIETSSLILLEPVVYQEQEFVRGNKSLGPKVPTTIFEEENQNYSHQSKKSIKSQPSYPSLRSQSSQEIQVIEQEGSRYEGQVIEGKKNGKGRMTYPGGVYYQGEWANDQMSGYGCLFNAKGKLYYKGLWEMGNFHGKGIFFNSDEEPIQGSFDYKDFNQIGKKWKSFEGDFDNDKKHGEGVLTLTNGQILEAEWKDNAISGRGVFHTLNGLTIKGIWIDNMLYTVMDQFERSEH